MKHKLQHACIMSELVNQHDQLSSMHGVSSSDNPQAYSMVQTQAYYERVMIDFRIRTNYGSNWNENNGLDMGDVR